MWYANLGTVGQTRVERIGFPAISRRARDTRRTSDVPEAEANFERALALDPGNMTANQRLGAIAAARGDYDAAQRYLSAAQARDPMNAVTSRLMANTYLAMGLQADACLVAERARTRGAVGPWMFSMTECIAR